MAFLDEHGLARAWQNIKNYINTKVSGGSIEGAEEFYFTEETRIGTWIDGKPLYSIVSRGVTPSTSNSWNKIVEIPSMDRLLFAQISVYVNAASVKYTL